jgi:hypothetical protein
MMMRWPVILPALDLGFHSTDRAEGGRGNGAHPSLTGATMANRPRRGCRGITFTTRVTMWEMTQYSAAHCIAQFGEESELRNCSRIETTIPIDRWSTGVRGAEFAWRDTPPIRFRCW